MLGGVVACCCDSLPEEPVHGGAVRALCILCVLEFRFVCEGDFLEPVEEGDAAPYAALCPLRGVVVGVDEAWDQEGAAGEVFDGEDVRCVAIVYD